MQAENLFDITLSDDEQKESLQELLLGKEQPKNASLGTIMYKYSLYLPAFYFTLGKVMQALGTNLYGEQGTLKHFNCTDTTTILSIETILIVTNVMSTLSTRGIGNCENFLWPSIYLTTKKYHSRQEFTDYVPSLLSENYIISCHNEEYDLFKILPTRNIKKYTLENETKIKLQSLYLMLTADSTNKFAELDFKALKEFGVIKSEKMTTTPWNNGVTFAYWFIRVFCTLSLFFSTMASLLSAVTLAKRMKASTALTYFIIVTSISANVISYCNFNLTTMNTKNHDLCQSIQDGTFREKTKMSWNWHSFYLFITTFGMVANLGLGYLSMTGFFTVEPFNKTPQPIQMICIVLNALASIFTGYFNFAKSSYEIIEKISETKNCKMTLINASFSSIVFTDTSINCLGALLGLIKLFGEMTHQPKNNYSLALSMLMAVSYDFLTAGMSRNGAEKTIRWLENQSFFGGTKKENVNNFQASDNEENDNNSQSSDNEESDNLFSYA